MGSASSSRTPWFAGDEFTTADVQMSYPVNGLLERAAGLGPLDRIRGFVDRIRDRPAYRRAVERGGEPM
jgi:glutathione S-transferase